MRAKGDLSSLTEPLQLLVVGWELVDF